MPERHDRFAARAAVALLAAAVAWGAAVIVAPLMAAAAERGSATAIASAVVYVTGSLICHQRPERSFHAAGVQWPVCARCAGLYVSAGAVSLVLLAAGARTRSVPTRPLLLALCLAAVPTAISWSLERAGVLATGNASRAAFAMPLGVVIPLLIVQAWRKDPIRPEVN